MTLLSPENALQHLISASLKEGASDADASLGMSEGLSVSVREGKLESVERQESSGVSLRCFYGRRQAHVSGSELSTDALDLLVERCVAMARVAPEDEWCGLSGADELARDLPHIDLVGDDPDTEAVMEAEALEAEAAARAIEGVRDVPSAGIFWGISKGWVAASNGFTADRLDSYSGLGLSAVAARGDAMERDFESWTTRRKGSRPLPAEIGHLAGTRAVARLGARKISSRKSAVMFDRRVSASLLSAFTGAISGTAIARGTSFLKDKLHSQVFADGINIIDDPLRPLGMASRAHDGEGRPVSRTALIEDGKLTTWLLNGPAARQLGLTPNGFASSGFGDPPGISTSNLHMEPGTQSPEDLMASVPEGLRITEMFGPSINPNTGDYSVGVAGVWYEKGEPQFPVSEVTVADNLVAMFARLVPANDLEFRGAKNAPSLLIDGMSLAGS